MPILFGNDIKNYLVLKIYNSGIRTQKTVTNNSNTTTYKYNLIGSKITYEERTGDNACELYYAYTSTGKLYGFYYDGASNDGFYYYKRNLQGDIIGLLNSSGTEVTTYVYDSWGKLISKTGSLASTVGLDNPFHYRGYYYDDETSLYYLNQRYYNPEWGRFINADDFMGQTGGLLSHNVFAYCVNNPVMLCDPSGRVPSFNVRMTDTDTGEYRHAQFDGVVNFYVPMYKQGRTSLCWAFCQVMVESYRSGDYLTQKQARERARDLAISYHGSSEEEVWNAPGAPGNVGKIVNVDNINMLYDLLVENGPFYARYANGGTGHLVVVTGVDLHKGIVYTNNPWGIKGKQTFEEFLDGFAVNFLSSTDSMTLDAVYTIDW